MNSNRPSPPCPCSRDDFGPARADRRIEAGCRRNAEMDAIECRLGCVPPGQCPPVVHLEFALDALCVGLAFDDWGRIEDGAAMLKDAIGRLADDAGLPRGPGRDVVADRPELEEVVP